MCNYWALSERIKSKTLKQNNDIIGKQKAQFAELNKLKGGFS
jgi:hypothetical protein